MAYTLRNGVYYDSATGRQLGNASNVQQPQGDFSFSNGVISGPGGFSFDVGDAFRKNATTYGRNLNPQEINAWATNLADDAYRQKYGIQGAQLSQLGAASESGLRNQVMDWAKGQTFAPNAPQIQTAPAYNAFAPQQTSAVNNGRGAVPANDPFNMAAGGMPQATSQPNMFAKAPGVMPIEGGIGGGAVNKLNDPTQWAKFAGQVTKPETQTNVQASGVWSGAPGGMTPDQAQVWRNAGIDPNTIMYAGGSPNFNEMAPPSGTNPDFFGGRVPAPAPSANPINPNDPFNSTTPGVPTGPATGPGAGRGYPSTWNINNSPRFGGDTTMATDPTTGASYEVSPMYQWQKAQAEKGLSRQLRAMGRENSSFGTNSFANLYNALAAQEADKQYNREFAQQQLGQNAALALAQMANNQGSLYGNLDLSQYGDLGALIRDYANRQGGNAISEGAGIGNLNVGLYGAQAPQNTAIGQSNAQLYGNLGSLPLWLLQYYNSIGAK